MIKELIVNPPLVVDLPSPARSFWQIPPADLKLESNEAHIWLARLDEESAAAFGKFISDDERLRAKRFRFVLHRNRFIAGRGILRTILGKYLLKNPRRVCFKYGEFGKPSLADEWISEIKFNVSHSGDFAIFAVTRGREIGVDIEQIKTSFVDAAMIAFCLTEQEKQYFYTLPLNKRELFFFECWTRKESFMKACGLGLSLLPPNEIETLSFTNSSLDLAYSGGGFRPAGWSLQTLPFIPGCAAALAIEGNGSPRLRFWRQNSTKLPI